VLQPITLRGRSIMQRIVLAGARKLKNLPTLPHSLNPQ
jgi:hypothetical protein